MNIEKFAALARAGALVMGVAAASLCAPAASAQIKEAKDVHVIFVTHGQANDVYWSVVKNGVEAGQKAMGSQVEYHAPETFDMVQMARLIDAAVAAKPDALVVSIPDTTALKDSDHERQGGRHSGRCRRHRHRPGARVGPRPLGRRRLRIQQRRPRRRDHG